MPLVKNHIYCLAATRALRHLAHLAPWAFLCAATDIVHLLPLEKRISTLILVRTLTSKGDGRKDT